MQRGRIRHMGVTSVLALSLCLYFAFSCCRLVVLSHYVLQVHRVLHIFYKVIQFLSHIYYIQETFAVAF